MQHEARKKRHSFNSTLWTWQFHIVLIFKAKITKRDVATKVIEHVERNAKQRNKNPFPLGNIYRRFYLCKVGGKLINGCHPIQCCRGL